MAAPKQLGGWLRGVVKEAPSGDTLVIMGAVKSGIPPEKRLTLSSVIAPKLGRRDGSTRDEPFAWQAREFLRKLCVGKPCVFRVDYALEQAGGREFGSVFVNERDNAALALVGAGWAKVRAPGGQQSPYYDELAKAAEAAEARGIGVHTKDKDALAQAVREVSGEEFDGQALLASVGKGRQVQAVVEAVNSGSTLRVTLLPSLQSATIMVAGVQCPSMGRRAAPAAAEGADAAAVAAAPPPAAEAAPEPFAREARYFTEQRVLNKEVNIVLEGVSQFGVVVGTVLYPTRAPAAAAAAAAPGGGAAAAAEPAANGAAAAPAQEDLALALMKAGLARGAEWSLNMMSNGAFKLRETERAAKAARVGQWHNYVPQTGNSAKLSDKFSGRVTEVVSGDCVVVKDKASGVERRVNLSSVRAPRMGTRDRQPDPYAAEAKEFLRQRLIGKDVSVSLEYNRKVQPMPGEGAAPARPGAGDERVMSFGTVTITEGGQGGEEKVNNVAELLLVRGLGQVVKHRGDEERSAHYEDLMNAEEAGKKGKKGLWSNKEAPAPRLNDISLPGSAARAKQHLPFLQRAGRMQGVCEYVLSAHKLKIFVPKEGVTFAFSPSGVRCPQRAQPAAAGRPAVEEEAFAEEALAFTRENVLQRDVEVEVETVDKAGTFLGTLRVPGVRGGVNLGVALLEAGLAKLHPSFDANRVAGGAELERAQEAARRAKLKVWERDEPAASSAAADEDGAAAPAGAGARESVAVVVTDVVDASSFCVQLAAEPRVEWVAEQLAGMGLEGMPPPPAPLKNGDKCIAQFSGDGQWYRATVERAYTADPTAPQYDVHFMDFGNRERVKGGATRPITPALAAVPPQAHLATLAFVKAPALEDEYGLDAAQFLGELLGGGRRLPAVVERRERLAAGGKGWGAQAPQKLHLTIFERPGDVASSANARLLAAGLARFAPDPRASAGEGAEVAEALRACEEKARRSHVGMWRYGDPGEDSDQDDYPALGGRGGRR